MTSTTPLAEKTQSLVSAYKAETRKRWLTVALLLVPLIALILAGLVLGAAELSPAASWSALINKLTGQPTAKGAKLAETIVWQLRVPRVLMATIGGFALSVAGLMMQTILRNPLASPYTLGISAAASFGAAVTIVLSSRLPFIGEKLPFEWVIVTNSFACCLIATAAVFIMSKLQSVTPETIVLLGVSMMFMFSAGTSLLQYLGDQDQLAELAYWMFGSLNKATWTKTTIAGILLIFGLVMVQRWVWDLNALFSDDETAISSGVNVEKVRLKAMLLASLLTAAVVSFLGPIGFIGLVAPHLARIVVGGDHRYLVPATILLGGCVLLFADLLSRTLFAPVTIPVGIVTSFVGVPLLIVLMVRRKAEHW